MTLDQLLSDNLSRDFFAGDVGMFDESPLPGGQVERIRKGTIRLLKEWLESRYPEDSDLAASITQPFAEVRSFGRSPRIGSSQRAHPVVWKERARLLSAVHQALHTLRIHLAEDPAAAAVSYPYWLDEPVRAY